MNLDRRAVQIHSYRFTQLHDARYSDIAPFCFYRESVAFIFWKILWIPGKKKCWTELPINWGWAAVKVGLGELA